MKWICEHCKREHKTFLSKRQHEIHCKENPDRIPGARTGKSHKGSNQYIKARELGLPVPVGAMKGKPGTFRGRKHSEETREKISKSCIRYLEEHPEKVPYLLNHYSKGPSYPEIYWIDLIKNEKLDLSYHKQIGPYQLDFFNETKLLDLEIDGDQHHLDSRIVESDKRRTKYLEALGWKTLRVKWSDWQKKEEEEKREFIQLLRAFLI